MYGRDRRTMSKSRAQLESWSLIFVRYSRHYFRHCYSHCLFSTTWRQEQGDKRNELGWPPSISGMRNGQMIHKGKTPTDSVSVVDCAHLAVAMPCLSGNGWLFNLELVYFLTGMITFVRRTDLFVMKLSARRGNR